MRALLLVCLLVVAGAWQASGDRRLRQQHEQELLGAKVRLLGCGWTEQGFAWANLLILFVLQANPRQAFWQWMAKHKKAYTNDLKVGCGN